MTSGKVALQADVGNLLGEGTLWHPQLQCLFWFDIARHQIFRMSADGGSVSCRNLPRQASAAAWIDADRLLLAANDGLYTYLIESGDMSLLAELEAGIPGNRANDGRCDPWGRFWIGTMNRSGAGRNGAIYTYFAGAAPRLLRGNLGIPNSIAFAPDRRRAYFADSAEQTIFAMDLDPATGSVLGESVFATTSGTDAVPDGSVVDEQGNLWNAQWDAWRVVRYGPDGKINQVVELPVQRPTCPALGGRDFRTLYVSSAQIDLSPAALASQPGAGGIFACRTDVPGLPEHGFRGLAAARASAAPS